MIRRLKSNEKEQRRRIHHESTTTMKLVNNDTGEMRELNGLTAELSDTDEDRLGGTSTRTLDLGETD
jgi:hypothetical protein